MNENLKFFGKAWREKWPEFLISGGVRVMSTILLSSSSGVIAVALGANWILAAIAAGLFLIAAVLWIAVRQFEGLVREARSANRLRDSLRGLAGKFPENGDDASWAAWCDTAESLLRGMGKLRKSQVLIKIVKRTEPANRQQVAEAFIEGLIDESHRESQP